MKIKTLLKLAITFSLLIIISVGFEVFSIYRNHEKIKGIETVAGQVKSIVSNINALSSEYLLYYQERASRQWKKAHKNIDVLIFGPESKYLSEFVDLKSLRKTHGRSLKLFIRLEQARSKELATKANELLRLRQIKALSEQLLSTSQFMSQKAEDLASFVDVKKAEIEQELYWLAIVLFIIFVMVLLVSWGLIVYRIVIPVNKFKNHIVNVDAEHLDKKYDVIRNDEVGELISSFNTMSEILFNTTVSKEKLVDEINERKKSEEELKNQQDLNSSVLEGISNVVIILDSNNNCVKFNSSAEEATGYSRNEFLNKPIWDFLVPKEERDEVKELFRTLKENKGSISGFRENHLQVKSGERRLFEWRDDLIHDSLNEITHIVTVGLDITEKRNREIEKQRIDRELNQSRKMEALGKLTGGIAHDFNNMLAIIIGYTDLALAKIEKETKPSITNDLEQIQIASNRAKNLVAKMLTFSRAEQADAEALQLAPLIDESIKLMSSILPSTIKIETEMESNIPDILMNPVQFQQMIMNLMINAKDAMSNNGRIKLILKRYNEVGNECSSCHQKISGDWVEIVISDNGMGISKEIQERIFEPFFTTKELGKGTGMGLSVVHGIVKSYAGHIILKSNSEKGSSFHLLFPPVIGQENVITDENKNIDINGDGKRVLIVDDEELLAGVQSEMLNSYGYECTKRYNGSSALELILENENYFDLIITDQTMPELTGLELIAAIREKGLDIPVIITTGYSDDIKSDKVEFDKVSLLKKPVASEILRQAISNILI